MSETFAANSNISHYRIVSKIGSGGMGEVYLAQDTKLDRRVAIKFLNEESSRDSDKLNRFTQEAKAASALNHPNILTVYEIGETDDTNYIVTEFIEGKTLREHLSPKESLSLNTILKIGVQVSEALAAAHQAGIIHRDIKPENVMIRSDGYAKVLDFGLAKLTEKKNTDEVSLEGATKAFVKTNPGMVLGTVSYMSPEQARGKATDARTDIWSLGVVLYEMLSGKVPFQGETVNHIIISILEKEPLLLANAPNELQRIVRKTLTKDIEMRYQTAHDLLIDLKNLRRDLDIQGELERSTIPKREETAESGKENETQIHHQAAIEKTQEDKKILLTRNVTAASSLEYAVAQTKSHKLVSTIVGIVLLGAISAIAYFAFFTKSDTKQIESIAVMPFVNENGNVDNEYLSDGMTETLIGNLSQLPNLSVKARSSVFRYKGKDISPQTVGNELSVQAVLLGRVIQRGEMLTLSLELVNAQTENVIWIEQYNRKQADLVSLQSEIARDVSNKLRVKLSRTEESRVVKRYTDDTEAYELYLKGRFFAGGKITEEGQKKSIEYYQQAIGKDTNYALAYVGLAQSYMRLGHVWGFLPPRETFPKAKVAVMKALEIDETLADAHTALADYYLSYEWNWLGAEREIKRAIELSPNDAVAHSNYGSYLQTMGRLDEAIAARKLNREFDPLSPTATANAGYPHYYARQYDQAIEYYRKALELDPNYSWSYLWIGQAYLEKGMYSEAIADINKAVTLSEGNVRARATLGYAYAVAGKRGEARQVIGELQEESKRKYVSPYFIAVIYSGLGEKDQAFAWLERTYQERHPYLTLLKVEPVFDNLRADPRFQDLLRRVGFPQ